MEVRSECKLIIDARMFLHVCVCVKEREREKTVCSAQQYPLKYWSFPSQKFNNNNVIIMMSQESCITLQENNANCWCLHFCLRTFLQVNLCDVWTLCEWEGLSGSTSAQTVR